MEIGFAHREELLRLFSTILDEAYAKRVRDEATCTQGEKDCDSTPKSNTSFFDNPSLVLLPYLRLVVVDEHTENKTPLQYRAFDFPLHKHYCLDPPSLSTPRT
jgi:hypothetical protein